MSSFVYDNSNLPIGKQDRTPLPPGENPNKWIQAIDWNTTLQASYDLRSAILNNLFFGITPQTSVPATPVGASSFLLWVRDSDKHLIYTHSGIDTDLSAGGGGGGTVTSITAGAGLSGGTITTTGTISMPNVGPGTGTYGGGGNVIESVTLDNQGRLSSLTTITASGTFTGSIANQQVAFGIGANVLGGSSNFIWDGTNLQLATQGTWDGINLTARNNGSGGDGRIIIKGWFAYNTLTDTDVTIGAFNQHLIAGSSLVKFVNDTSLVARITGQGSWLYSLLANDVNSHNTASTEFPDFDFGINRITTWDAGAVSIQRDVIFRQHTLAFDGASIVTDAATVAIVGAPIAGTNATITNSYSLLVQAGMSSFVGGATIKGTEVDPSSPVLNQVLQYNGTKFVPQNSNFEGYYTTAGRPAANTIAVGHYYYDTNYLAPITSDGTNWRDANGVLS